MEKEMDIELFDYDLPKELIAQTPLEKRDTSRLMVLNKNTGEVTHRHFYDLIDYLKAGDVLVRNNTKVIPARLFGTKEETHAHVEVLLLKNLHDDVWECLCGNARTIKQDTIISFGDGRLKAKCLEVREEGIRVLEMMYEGIFYEVLDQLGVMPLPPYIKEKLEDPDRYNTVYAKVEGSAAAPTAGLHFTPELFDKIRAKGVTVLDVTLHVGLGTFRPVKVENVLEHHMHSEYYEIDEATADALNKAKAEGRRIIAIGTTSCRTLEANMSKYGKFTPTHENTAIFIYPGYEYKAIDCLVTNFHLPKSTLIMLVSALAGRENILNAYKIAVQEKYRFFSFGDAMFITDETEL